MDSDLYKFEWLLRLSSKEDFKTNVTGDNKHHIIIRGETYQENIMIVDSYASNTVIPKFKTQVLLNINR